MVSLQKLLHGLEVRWSRGPLDREIKGIAYDSRLAGKDYLFVAVTGYSVDGHAYIEDAVNRGATVIVAEHPAEGLHSGSAVPGGTGFVCVQDSREALALISSAFYGHPSRRLSLIGITGTNGKTTTAFITRDIFTAAGKGTGLLGTISYMTGSRKDNARNTTPESLDLQGYLCEMVDNGMKYGVVEVSSHALALSRVRGCSFRTAVFTSFSQDHLDFHTSMDDYFNTKKTIFEYLHPEGTAVLNWDDKKIRELADELPCRVLTCGIQEGAMIRAENIVGCTHDPCGEKGASRSWGTSFDVCTPDSTFRIESRLMGMFNVTNVLLSIGAARSLGLSDDEIRQGVREAMPVEGRFEPVDEGQAFLCIVDYAHTDDALRKLLEQARPLTKGRIITVFGCGGDRDRTKRALMGAAAAALSDVVIITSDNPRTENPSRIIEDILQGTGGSHPLTVLDRGEAIAQAVRMAEAGDTLLIAGKGHESYQEIQGKRQHFSDRESARREIQKFLAGA